MCILKISKIMTSVLVASTLFGTVLPQAYAGSIGRSSSSSSSSSSSHSSSSSVSRPAQSSSYSAPKQGGIGGNSGSMGVRKSEVTTPVANKVEQKRIAQTPAPTTPSAPAGQYSSQQPAYGTPHQPAPVIVQQSSGSPFLSSLGGAFAGTMLGNAMSNHGNNGGTTVVNNGSGGSNGGGVSSTASMVDQGGQVTQVQPMIVPQQSSYGIWGFTKDVISFALLVAVLVGLAWVFYKGFKMVSSYIKRERGDAPTQPFSPTAKFWEIQKAFGAADIEKLKELLGPDLVDELTMDAQPSELALHNVSHEIVLNNPREFSIHYTFEDSGDVIDQVWHYELHDTKWKLNGIETV
jgi:hypothetical protein